MCHVCVPLKIWPEVKFKQIMDQFDHENSIQFQYWFETLCAWLNKTQNTNDTR